MRNADADAMILTTYCATLGICAAAALGAIGCGLFFLPLVIAGQLAMGQGVVYGFIAIYAWNCREHVGASRYLLAVSLIWAGVSGGILFLVCPKSNGLHLIIAIWLQIGQAALAMFGGYLGYAALERRRTRRRGEPATGKLAVATILLAAGAIAVAMVFSQL